MKQQPKRGKTAFIDLTGRSFGKLRVLRRAETRVSPNGTQCTYWFCRCDCGKEKEVSSANLRKKKVQSCGSTACKGVVLKGGERWVYSTYKHSAKERKLKFQLTSEQVAQLCQSPCHYCDAAPNNPASKNWVAKAYPLFRYNGIDRIDSTKGYVSDNVVSCCYACNLAKSNMTLDEFLDWVRRIYRHSIAKEASA